MKKNVAAIIGLSFTGTVYTEDQVTSDILYLHSQQVPAETLVFIDSDITGREATESEVANVFTSDDLASVLSRKEDNLVATIADLSQGNTQNLESPELSSASEVTITQGSSINYQVQSSINVNDLYFKRILEENQDEQGVFVDRNTGNVFGGQALTTADSPFNLEVAIATAFGNKIHGITINIAAAALNAQIMNVEGYDLTVSELTNFNIDLSVDLADTTTVTGVYVETPVDSVFHATISGQNIYMFRNSLDNNNWVIVTLGASETPATLNALTNMTLSNSESDYQVVTANSVAGENGRQIPEAGINVAYI